MLHHVIERGLPIPKPVPELSLLSSKELETRVVHATRLHKNWNMLPPEVRRSITTFPASMTGDIETMEQTSVKQLFFLQGYGGELVVTLAGRAITCWEVPLNGVQKMGEGTGSYVQQ